MNKEQLNFIKRIERFCNSENLFEKGSRVGLFVGRRADSVCLLRVLLELRERFSLTLYAAHVNHMLRGADADADEQFCRKYCVQLGVELLFCTKMRRVLPAKRDKASRRRRGRYATITFYAAKAAWP